MDNNHALFTILLHGNRRMVCRVYTVQCIFYVDFGKAKVPHTFTRNVFKIIQYFCFFDIIGTGTFGYSMCHNVGAYLSNYGDICAFSAMDIEIIFSLFFIYLHEHKRRPRLRLLLMTHHRQNVEYIHMRVYKEKWFKSFFKWQFEQTHPFITSTLNAAQFCTTHRFSKQIHCNAFDWMWASKQYVVHMRCDISKNNKKSMIFYFIFWYFGKTRRRLVKCVSNNERIHVKALI